MTLTLVCVGGGGGGGVRGGLCLAQTNRMQQHID